MVRQCAGVVREVDGRTIGGLEVLLRVFARHFDVAAEGKQADLVIGIAVCDADQARTKTDRESLNAHAAELCYGKVAELVDYDHHADQDDKGGDRNQKLMHRLSNFPSTRHFCELVMRLSTDRGLPIAPHGPFDALRGRRRAPPR